jgi:hypothetical protein
VKFEITTTYECEETTCGKVMEKLIASGDIYCMGEWSFMEPRDKSVDTFYNSWDWIGLRHPSKKLYLVKEIKTRSKLI